MPGRVPFGKERLLLIEDMRLYENRLNSCHSKGPPYLNSKTSGNPMGHNLPPPVSFYLSIYPYIYLPTDLSIYLFIHLYIYIYTSVCKHVYTYVHTTRSINDAINPYTYTSAYSETASAGQAGLSCIRPRPSEARSAARQPPPSTLSRRRSAPAEAVEGAASSWLPRATVGA